MRRCSVYNTYPDRDDAKLRYRGWLMQIMPSQYYLKLAVLGQDGKLREENSDHVKIDVPEIIPLV